MSNALILVAVIAAALAIGFALRARGGRVRAVVPSAVPAAAEPDTDPVRRLLIEAGVSETAPTILHFSATWCGPCAAVRRIISQATAALADEGLTVLDLELDIDENPALAKELKVLSLPTTFLYDASATLAHRIAGVPKADALRTALRSLP